MRRIKIAQIGINRYSHGPELFFTMKQFPEIFELVGYVLVEDERETCAKKIEDFYGEYPELTLSEVLEDPTIEAVTVETDEIHLFKYAQMAADHGKHIHMEKPGSQSVEDFERLIETVRKNQTVFHVGYMYRYHPLIAETVRRARSGELGEIFSVETHMSRYDKREGREWLECFRGGMMFYLGSNLIDVILRIQGEPERILPLNRSTGFDGVESEDFGFAALVYPNGVSLVRTSAVEVGGGSRRQIVVCGEKGTVRIQPIEAEYPTPTWECMYFSESDEVILDENKKGVRSHKVSDPFQRYGAMITAFAAMVRGEMENPYTLDYELTLFRTIMKCCGEEA
jgi:predicted dehydrogenase